MILRKKHLRALILGAMMSAGLVTVTLAPRVALAQTSKGTLTGVVRDISGAVIVNANITATNSETGEVRKTTTSSLGAYRLDAVTPGPYTLRVEFTGFQAFNATDVRVTASQTVSYDVSLQPGNVSQTVSVSADEILLNQENASLSATIGTASLNELPIFSLNPVEVLTTIPGVQIVSNTGLSNGDNIQVSGARPRSNNFMIDGQEINDAGIGGQALQPNIPDMVADTVIFTHNAPAEFGRASGGVVNIITKSGTNSFHGTAWELYSGSGLNATDGQTRQVVPKDSANKARYDQHQYGFTAGGPALKNKLFGFGAMQLTRYYGNETALQVSLPDKNGIDLLKALAASNTAASTNATLMLGYLSNAAYLNSYLQYTVLGATSGSTAPVYKSLGAACPATIPACANAVKPGYIEIGIFQRPPTPALSPDTQWNYRVDYTPTTKDTFTFRYLHDRGSLTPDFFTNGTSLPGFDTYQGGPGELGQGTWTHVFTQSFLNEFRVAETRISFLFAPTAETLANPLYTSPQISTGSISTLGFNQTFPQGRAQDMYQYQDTVSWTHGRHTVRAGADIGRRIEKDLNGLNVHGTLTFAAGGTGATQIGNFLLNQLGPSGSATKVFGSPRVDPHSWRSGIFGQDDVKLTPDLTANLGIRWDYFTVPDNSLPYPAIDPTSAASLYGPINTRYLVADNRHSFAPRIGFAYTPHNRMWLADGKTVIRAGFGIFFDSEFTNITVNNAASAPNIAGGTLTATAATAPNGLANATGLISQISATVNPQSSVTSVDKNLTNPYSPEWNLTVERELPYKIGLSVTYAGSRGIKLYANQQYNYFDSVTGARLDPTRGAIVARGNYADSGYNGLEIGARHNFSRSFMVTGSYVYSKTLDDGSEVFASGNTPTSYSANLAPGGRHQDWGTSVYDHRQYAAFTYVWSPGGLHSDNKGADAIYSGLTRHWTISGSSRFQSGSYSTVNFLGLDSNGDGSTANDRPILSNKNAPINSAGIDGHYSSWLGGPATTGTYYDVNTNNTTGDIVPVDPSKVHWLIPYGAQFLSQEIGRNSILNPGEAYHDIALEKAIPTPFLHTDKGRFVLRAEAQNFANHNNVGQLDINLLDIGTSGFQNASNAREGSGTPGANRALRFWAKYTF
jgi:outer membrane receptor protein involved in Fe transport